MAERKKKRTLRRKKGNVIDDTMKKGSELYGKAKKEVTGSKTLRSAAEGTKRAMDVATGMSKNLGTRAKETVSPKAKAAAEQARAAAAKATNLRRGGAAAANERVRARQAGPQQGTPYKNAKPADGFRGNQQPADRTRADAQKSFEERQAKAAEKPKRTMTERGLRASGRGLTRLGAPHALVAGAGESIIDAYAGSDNATEGTRQLVEGAADTLANAPTSLRAGAREFINNPVKGTASALAAIPDAFFNTAMTATNALQSQFGDEGGIELTDDLQDTPIGRDLKSRQDAARYRDLSAATESTRNPAGRLVDQLFGGGEDKQLPAATQQAPVGPKAEDAAAGAPGTEAAKTRGLGAAMSNREFLADEAGKFRSGFDVLKDAGVKRTGGIGDLAQYNAATGIAKRENTTKKAARELNVAEAEARANIEGQNVTNALNLSKAQKNQFDTDNTFRKNVIESGEKARTMLEKHTQLKEASTDFFDSAKKKKELKDFQDVTINQALQSNFDPQMPDSVAASQMLADEIRPAMDRGVLQGVVDAMVSSGFDAADILNNNGDLAINRETMDLMSVTQDDDGDTVIGMEVPTQDAQGNVVMEVRPLFFADEIQDPNMRDHMIRLLTKTSGQARTLQNANR